MPRTIFAVLQRHRQSSEEDSSYSPAIRRNKSTTPTSHINRSPRHNAPLLASSARSKDHRISVREHATAGVQLQISSRAVTTFARYAERPWRASRSSCSCERGFEHIQLDTTVQSNVIAEFEYDEGLGPVLAVLLIPRWRELGVVQW